MKRTPDTSPANVARVLRDCALEIDKDIADEARALADALDAQAAELRARPASIGIFDLIPTATP